MKFHFLLLPLTLMLWLVHLYPAQAASLEGTFSFGLEGDNIVAALSVHIPPDFHAYSHDTEHAAQATQLQLSLTTQEATLPLAFFYPKGETQPDYYDPAVTSLVYKNDIVIFVVLPKEAMGQAYTGELRCLLCSARQCLPAKLILQGSIPESVSNISDMPWYATWAMCKKESSSQVLGVSPTPAFKSASVLRNITPKYDTDFLEVSHLWKALLLGLLAGLLLNVMPCVLPVLALKASALFAEYSNNLSSARHLRAQNLCFAAGIILFFTLLALFMGLSGSMWGQLFQSPTIVLTLILVVFLLALSLFGIFTLPVIDLKFTGKIHHSRWRALMTGALVTLLATPCSGPLLGGVLAWCYGQPLNIVLLVFWSIGLGMALPYLLLTMWPTLASFLPKPGPWLMVLEKCMGFCLLASVIYLLSILPSSMHLRVLCLLLVLAMVFACYGKFCTLRAKPALRLMGQCVCLTFFVGGIFWISSPGRQQAVWQEYSPVTFVRQLGQQPMLLEFTSDWCPNCKFIEQSVLTAERLETWKQQYNIKFIKVDITAADAPGLELLHQLGSNSIPLTALFPLGIDAQTPLVLRDVYGVDRLERAMAQTFREN